MQDVGAAFISLRCIYNLRRDVKQFVFNAKSMLEINQTLCNRIEKKRPYPSILVVMLLKSHFKNYLSLNNKNKTTSDVHNKSPILQRRSFTLSTEQNLTITSIRRRRSLKILENKIKEEEISKILANPPPPQPPSPPPSPVPYRINNPKKYEVESLERRIKLLKNIRQRNHGRK